MKFGFVKNACKEEVLSQRRRGKNQVAGSKGTRAFILLENCLLYSDAGRIFYFISFYLLFELGFFMKGLLFVLLGVLFFSPFCFAHDMIEVGGALVHNPAVFRDTGLGGGINAAFFPKIINSFGIGIFLNLAFASDATAFDILAGPYYEFKITDKLSLPVSAGFYWGFIYFFGFGGNVTLQYAFHKNFSVFARFQCVYAYFSAPGVKAFGALVMQPCAGVGFRFL